MENKKKYYFVYKTTNLKNNKFYIGVHETYEIDDGYLGSGKVLRNSIFYHGKENFKREILEFCGNKQSMYRKEKELVTEELISNPKCMNLKIGGNGGLYNKKHHKKMIEGSRIYQLTKWKDPNYRKNISEHASINIKKNHINGCYDYNKLDWTGKKHTEETKNKMRKTKNVGINNSQFGTCWITNEINNKKIYKGDSIPEGWRLGRKVKLLGR